MTSLIGGIVEYWSANKDPLGSQFPLVQGGPWALLAIMAFFAIIVIFVGPVFMRNRKLGRIRPYLVVYNGFMFGVNGTGFIVTLILI
ncbi:hypothetical protein HDE_05162 [Halotydeus destructor]|nr:hypothetical protein HDE_05162 [Halotydeus destructor]